MKKHKYKVGAVVTLKSLRRPILYKIVSTPIRSAQPRFFNSVFLDEMPVYDIREIGTNSIHCGIVESVLAIPNMFYIWKELNRS